MFRASLVLTGILGVTWFWIFTKSSQSSFGGGKVMGLEGTSFESEVLAADGVVLVDFYADWCPPCKRLAPHLGELSDIVKVVKVDIDKNQEIARKFGVRAIPDLRVFQNGEELGKIRAIPDASALRSELQKFL